MTKFLVIGLGNIGYDYMNTRHNIGFSILDAWAEASNISFKSRRYGDIAETNLEDKLFYLLKPSTYMNLSGRAAYYWLKKLNIPIENMLVISDDTALPLGTIRMRRGGSSGGHNGLANIAEMLGTENFPRLRIGIGSHFGFGSQIDFVLGKWTPEEEEILPEVTRRAIEAVKSFGVAGIDRTMTLFNRKESIQQ